MIVSLPEPIRPDHDVSAFSCGKPALNRWLRERAVSNQQKGFTAVMVVQAQERVVGFYGLAPTAVVPGFFPRAIRTGQPPDPVPCILLGQLAVDQTYAGCGVGNGLLKHALQRSIMAAGLIGGRALMVNAIDEEAQAFWASRGFTPTRDDPMLLYRSIADIAKSLAVAGLSVR
ncbi:GNAT family N-acetyltransferase [Sandaracinobacteroides saxicola]|uniref:GNAT family N-acetyltransferase n=1 Tax=Sandaracinobacteroides saxicola TaxID=2759707 RepID=A0A7G5IH73_9SPHN|nr:GNAT family N-acetyltransferase [Sandaracinobacteroides saxicola]QMW22715.1 GNAT family N-acetyltransferase [Sandaracinobacteroides saxicola]